MFDLQLFLFFVLVIYVLLDFQRKYRSSMHQKKKTTQPKGQLLKFLLDRLCRSELCRARPDKAGRINIFHLSVAAGAEWCCQVA